MTFISLKDTCYFIINIIIMAWEVMFDKKNFQLQTTLY